MGRGTMKTSYLKTVCKKMASSSWMENEKNPRFSILVVRISTRCETKTKTEGKKKKKKKGKKKNSFRIRAPPPRKTKLPSVPADRQLRLRRRRKRSDARTTMKSRKSVVAD